MDFWQRIQTLLDTSRVVIDRPAGTRHPNYPDVVYPVNYGYLDETVGGDGQPIEQFHTNQYMSGLVIMRNELK